MEPGIFCMVVCRAVWPSPSGGLDIWAGGRGHDIFVDCLGFGHTGSGGQLSGVSHCLCPGHEYPWEDDAQMQKKLEPATRLW